MMKNLIQLLASFIEYREIRVIKAFYAFFTEKIRPRRK